ncbi:hypothetical protein [Nocardioides ungokensis]|nr:hypothetical protein [Nocardioides ungokensis]
MRPTRRRVRGGGVVSFTCWCGTEQAMTAGRAATRSTKVTLAA